MCTCHGQKTRQLYKRGKAANKELSETADFRNGRLLNGFLSEAGKLFTPHQQGGCEGAAPDCQGSEDGTHDGDPAIHGPASCVCQGRKNPYS
jgi:hypothetical protein